MISSIMGICQGDPLGRTLFALSHFKALCFTPNHFLNLFSSIADDTHIISPLSIVSFVYEHFQIELYVIGFFYLTLEMCGMVMRPQTP
jgi:hypothetical protein